LSGTAIEWKRRLVEGLVILVSILLAFGIDAWWDERRENHAAHRQVDRVLAELETNAEILGMHIQWMEAATAASVDFLALCGPDPEAVSSQAIGHLFDGTFGVPTLSVSRNAAQRFLASGLLAEGEWASIRQVLAKLLSRWQEEERDSLELRQYRVPMMERTGQLIPALNTSLQHPVMSRYQISKFPFDSKALLSDMEFEGHLASYAIRLELNLRDLAALLDLHKELIDNIKATRGP
jgi:hypothetical protein